MYPSKGLRVVIDPTLLLPTRFLTKFSFFLCLLSGYSVKILVFETIQTPAPQPSVLALSPLPSPSMSFRAPTIPFSTANSSLWLWLIDKIAGGTSTDKNICFRNLFAIVATKHAFSDRPQSVNLVNQWGAARKDLPSRCAIGNATSELDDRYSDVAGTACSLNVSF